SKKKPKTPSQFLEYAREIEVLYELSSSKLKPNTTNQTITATTTTPPLSNDPFAAALPSNINNSPSGQRNFYDTNEITNLQRPKHPWFSSF
ncbi:unnamed protein product, partial [Didymodactylos carnosus]